MNAQDRATRDALALQLRNARLCRRLERLGAMVHVRLAQKRRREGESERN